MDIQKFTIGTFGENVYVASDRITKEAFVVDPGKNIDIIIDYIKKNDLKLKYIFITHAHIDHIEGVEPLNRRIGGKILLHTEDIPALEDEEASLAYMLTGPFDKFTSYSSVEKEIDLKIGEINIEVIHTPGHTRGSVCILADNSLFSGDTLFRDSIGRTDFVGGDFKQIISSIKEKLLVLDDDIVIYPGHGENSTVSYERENNSFINGNIYDDY